MSSSLRIAANVAGDPVRLPAAVSAAVPARLLAGASAAVPARLPAGASEVVPAADNAAVAVSVLPVPGPAEIGAVPVDQASPRTE